jgi:hypothetical protein
MTDSQSLEPLLDGVPSESTTSQESIEAESEIALPAKTTPSPSGQQEACYCKPNQTPLWKILIETGAVFVGICAVVIISEQLYVLERQMIVVQRSWLQVKMTNDPTLKDTKDRIIVRVINKGNTPAGKIAVQSAFEVVPYHKGPSFDYSRTHNTTTVPIMFQQGDAEILTKLYTSDGALTQVTDAQPRDLVSGQSYLTVYGTVTYEDNFGAWWTHFCFWKGFRSGQDYSTQPCREYNEVGKQ